MASGLAITWGCGPPSKRRREWIPDVISINSYGDRPQSGATDFNGNAPGCRTPRPDPHYISRGITHPGNPPWELAGNVDISRRIPRTGYLEASAARRKARRQLPYRIARRVYRGAALGAMAGRFGFRG